MEKPLISRISDISSLVLLAFVLYTSQPEKQQEQTSMVKDKNGRVFLQLQEGQMQLQPTSGEAPIIMAYQRTLPEAVQQDNSTGNWICE